MLDSDTTQEHKKGNELEELDEVSDVIEGNTENTENEENISNRAEEVRSEDTTEGIDAETVRKSDTLTSEELRELSKHLNDGDDGDGDIKMNRTESGSFESLLTTEDEHLTTADAMAFEQEDIDEMEEEHEEDAHILTAQTSALSKLSITEIPTEIYKPNEELFDRSLYYKMYDTYNLQLAAEKDKNDYLHRQMTNYYRKKKMLHVLQKDTQSGAELERKYNKYLDELEHLNDTLSKEQIKIQCEFDSLTNKYHRQNAEANKLFEELQKSQLEFTKEFESSDPARESAMKAVVERCMKRQKVQLGNLKKMRLSYIKCKNRLQETEDALNALDSFGSNLHLIDYEQLKMDNRNLRDKLEERELELARIRTKCQNAMQVLAHLREKVTSVNAYIKDKEDRLENVKEEYEDSREQLNYLKVERDQIRRQVTTMLHESGLLTRPLLLHDMEFAVTKLNDLSEKVESVKAEYNLKQRRIRIMRSMMNAITKETSEEQRLLKISKLLAVKPKYSTSDDV